MTELPRPTRAELDVLRVLWDDGASTVREVHSALERSEPVVYTTVLKQLQIMQAKGLVVRDTARKTHVYRAAVPRETTQRSLVEDLIARAFGGSALGLVMRAVEGGVSRDELAAIRAMVDEAAGDEP